jgi:hypothetical protein
MKAQNGIEQGHSVEVECPVHSLYSATRSVCILGVHTTRTVLSHANAHEDFMYAL